MSDWVIIMYNFWEKIIHIHSPHLVIAWQQAGENISVTHQARQLPLWTKHKRLWQGLRYSKNVPFIPRSHCYSLIVKWSLLGRRGCLIVITANTFLTNYRRYTFSYKIHHKWFFFKKEMYCKGRKTTSFFQAPLFCSRDLSWEMEGLINH